MPSGEARLTDRPIDALERDIDDRLLELRVEMLRSEGEFDVEFVACLMRAAYGRGYCDALREESEGDRGRLCVQHGYAVPGG